MRFEMPKANFGEVDCRPGPAKEYPGVFRELDVLQNSIASLTSAFSDLESRLVPAMRASPIPDRGSGDNCQPPMSGLAANIHDRVREVQLLQIKVLDTIANLDI
jgi:hypothetical protein